MLPELQKMNEVSAALVKLLSYSKSFSLAYCVFCLIFKVPIY